MRHISLSLSLLLLLTSPSFAQTQTPAPLEVIPEKVWATGYKPVKGRTRIRLSKYRGRVIVLGIWASWCEPCRASVVGLSELNKEFARRGVVVVGLTTEDPAQSPKPVRDFISKAKPRLRVGWASREEAITLLRAPPSIPQILVISREGTVLTRFRGWSEYVPGFLRTSVEKGLATPPAEPRPDERQAQ
jgi:thiol-disulfide isomerase/thioredoxin